MNFCSRASIETGEAVAGTGVRAAAYVFIPVPKALWHSNELNAGWASPQEIAAVQGARKGGVVTRLYNPPKEGPVPAVLVFAGPSRPAPPGLAPLLEVLGQRWAIDPAPGPRLAICTHGTRDRCCAKWGFAAFTAGRALFAQGLTPFEPMECSHLGGDRFAATGILFPSGSMYAHLDSADLAALGQAEAAGRIVARYYRGRVFDPQLTQVVRAGLARDGLFDDSTAPISLGQAEAGEVRVGLPDGRQLSVFLSETPVRFYGSCAKMADGKASSGMRTVYVRAVPINGDTGSPPAGPGAGSSAPPGSTAA